MRPGLGLNVGIFVGRNVGAVVGTRVGSRVGADVIMLGVDISSRFFIKSKNGVKFIDPNPVTGSHPPTALNPC